ncbi:MAG TPA: protein-glutamate O-methyltransferase CheR [Dongiaceae bacterium]|nr:protein-glutamate O-methyltransferase CheR [Dongiaceae bacterium]
MTQADFDYLVHLLYQRSGLVLGPDKGYLLESRLMPVMRKWKVITIGELVQRMRIQANEDMITSVVEAMTTNESFFFRDQKPFDQLRTVVLPALIKARGQQKTLRIWSAACSTGQEPYSIAMILNEMNLPNSGWRCDIVATDLSQEVLEKAREGAYSQFEVQRGLPVQMLVKYFTQNGDRWHIDPKIRAMVRFQPFNLLQNPGSLGRFDVIFCRNVLIYFDQPTKTKVLSVLATVMSPDGTLFLGGAETMLGLGNSFTGVPEHRGLYRPTPPVSGLRENASLGRAAP